MGKNTFQKPTGPAATENPIAQAQQDADAKVAQQEQQGAAAGSEASAEQNQSGAEVANQGAGAEQGTGAVQAAAEQAPAESVSLASLAVKAEAEVPSAEPAAAAKVEDTSTERHIEHKAVVQRAHRQPLAATVSRPAGGRQREASPSDASGVASERVDTGFSALIEQEKKSGTVSAIALIAFLEDYVKTMQPGRSTTTAEIIRSQEGLFDHLTHVISRAPANEFKRLWNIVIAFFTAYKNGAFNPRYYGRGAKDWKRDPAQFLLLTGLINLLEISATDIDSVAAQVDIGALADNGFSEEARGRLISFYAK